MPGSTDNTLPNDGRLGEYLLEEELGRGGFGAVYRATHRRLKRAVAVKVLHPSWTQDPAVLGRFEREMEIVARVDHPNIVRALDAGEEAGHHFLVMEYLDGVSLDRHLARNGPLLADLACLVIAEAARGLQHAHEQGLIHRDLKPANLFLARRGDRPGGHSVKILDLGLARLQGGSEDTPGLTGTGVMMGSVDYMAPEQFEHARDVDIRADIYSLGCTLYHLLSGRPPHPGGSVWQKYYAHREKQPDPIESLRDDLPPGLAALVARMMAKPPEARPSTPGEVAEALRPHARPADSPIGEPPGGSAPAAREAAFVPTTLGATPTPRPLGMPAPPPDPKPPGIDISGFALAGGPPTRARRGYVWLAVPLLLVALVEGTALARRSSAGGSTRGPVADKLLASSWAVRASNFGPWQQMFQQGFREGHVWSFDPDGTLRGGALTDEGRYKRGLLQSPDHYRWRVDGGTLVLSHDTREERGPYAFRLPASFDQELVLENRESGWRIDLGRMARVKEEPWRPYVYGVLSIPIVAAATAWALARRWVGRRVFVFLGCWLLTLLLAAALGAGLGYLLDTLYGMDFMPGWLVLGAADAIAGLVVGLVPAIAACLRSPRRRSPADGAAIA